MAFEGAQGALQRLQEVEARLARMEAKFEEASEKARQETTGAVQHDGQSFDTTLALVKADHERTKESIQDTLVTKSRDNVDECNMLSRDMETASAISRRIDAKIEGLQSRLDADRAQPATEPKLSRFEEAQALLDGIIQRFEEDEDRWIREVLLKD